MDTGQIIVAVTVFSGIAGILAFLGFKPDGPQFLAGLRARLTAGKLRDKKLQEQVEALQTQVAELTKSSVEEAPQSSYPTDTTPTVERRLAEVEEALRQTGQTITDQRNELMGKIQKEQEANAALTAQLQALTSEEAKRKKALEQQESYLRHLTEAEKDVLRPYVVEGTRTQSLFFDDGVVIGLVSEGIIARASEMFRLGLPSAHNMPREIFDYLNQHPEILGLQGKSDLQVLHDEAVRRLNMQSEPLEWREVAGIQPDLGYFNLIGIAHGLPRPIKNQADLDTYMPVQD